MSLHDHSCDWSQCHKKHSVWVAVLPCVDWVWDCRFVALCSQIFTSINSAHTLIKYILMGTYFNCGTSLKFVVLFTISEVSGIIACRKDTRYMVGELASTYTYYISTGIASLAGDAANTFGFWKGLAQLQTYWAGYAGTICSSLVELQM